MPSFKPKKEKKQNLNNIPVTLDDKHQEFVDTFNNNNNNVIPKLKEEKKNLKVLIGFKNNIIKDNVELTEKIDNEKINKLFY